MDLKLDLLTGDLALEGGDVVLVDGVEAIAQHIRIRLNFFQGEWFLDAREGVPYYQEILGQKPDIGRVNEIFRNVLATTPGVLSVDSIQVDIDNAERNLQVNFRVTTDAGPLNSADIEAPFIVELT